MASPILGWPGRFGPTFAGPPSAGPLSVGAQSAGLFFPSTPIFILFFSLWGSSRVFFPLSRTKQFLKKIQTINCKRRVEAPKGGGPEGWRPQPGKSGAPNFGAPKGGGPKISRLFFTLPPQCSFFSPSWGSLSWNFDGVFEAPGP